VATEFTAQTNDWREAIPVVLGGIIPKADMDALKSVGIERIFTPKDYDLMDVMNQMMDVVLERKKSLA